jgi:hypothetical protein
MANKKYDKITVGEAAKVHATKPNLESVVKKIVKEAVETTPTRILQDPEEWPNLSQILMIEPKDGEEFNWEGFADDFNTRVKDNAAPGKNLKKLTAGECRKGARQHCRRRLAEANEVLEENPADQSAKAKKDEALKIIYLRGWTEIARGWTAEDDDTKLKARSNQDAKARSKATDRRAVIAGNGSSGKIDHNAPGITTADAGLAPAAPAEVSPVIEPGGPEDKTARIPEIESDGRLPGTTGDGPANPAAQAPGNPLERVPIEITGKDEDAPLSTPGTIEYLVPQKQENCAPYRNKGPKPEGMVFVEGFAKPFSDFINTNNGGFDGKAWIKPELAELLQRSINKFKVEHPRQKN